MRRIILACFFSLVTLFAFAQDRQAILKVMDNQRRDWNNGDIDAFMQSYWKSDSLLFVGKAGPNYGWQTTLDNYKKHYPDKATMGKLKFDILKISILDKTNAFVLGAWNLKREKGNLGGYFTLWFRKFRDGWKIVVDHTS